MLWNRSSNLLLLCRVAIVGGLIVIFRRDAVSQPTYFRFTIAWFALWSTSRNFCRGRRLLVSCFCGKAWCLSRRVSSEASHVEAITLMRKERSSRLGFVSNILRVPSVYLLVVLESADFELIWWLYQSQISGKLNEAMPQSLPSHLVGIFNSHGGRREHCPKYAGQHCEHTAASSDNWVKCIPLDHQ